MNSNEELQKQVAQLTETVLTLSRTIEALSRMIVDDTEDVPGQDEPMYLNRRN